MSPPRLLMAASVNCSAHQLSTEVLPPTEMPAYFALYRR